MTVVVADASALVEYLLRTRRAAEVEVTIEAADVDLHTPALCDVEVTAALRRGLLAESLSTPRAAQAMKSFLDLPLTRHGHQSLLPRVLELRHNFSAYDAVYVSLAERLAAPLLTSDERLAGATRRVLAIPVLP